MGEREQKYLARDESIKSLIFEVNPVRTLQKDMHLELCLPDPSLAFSLCVEYATSWVLAGFAANFFKTIHVSGNHIIRDFRNHDFHDFARVQKPALAIIPEYDSGFDDDGRQIDLFGTRTYTRGRFLLQQSFFKDYQKKLFLAMEMELMLVHFTYRMKVDGKGMALHLMKHCRGRFHSKATKSEYIDIDYHIPTELMIALAKDTGFEVNEQERYIKNIDNFISYVNSRSASPIMYKWREAKGGFEFYIRVPNQVVHTAVKDVTVDDGDNEGHLQNNFVVEFQTDVRFPSPGKYAYFSAKAFDSLPKISSDKGSFGMYQFVLCKIPIENDKGWMQYAEFDYMDEDDYNKRPMVMTDLKETLFKIDDGRFLSMIQDHIDKYISPDMFMEIKVFNDQRQVPVIISWRDFSIKSKGILVDQISHVVIYVDLKYKNEYEYNKRGVSKSRIEQPGKYRAELENSEQMEAEIREKGQRKRERR